MALVLVGINHTTASIELREKVAFPPDLVEEALKQLSALDGVEESVIVSTCNRTEVYLEITEEGSAEGANEFEDGEHSDAADVETLDEQQTLIIEWLADFHGLDANNLHDSSYAFAHADVIRHLMKVACGLDSMVLGEPQILGQIKSAYAVSKELDLAGASLTRAFQGAFTIAKEVRTDTAIGENPVSVAYAAVTLAGRIFSDLGSLSVLLIGAGRTIELVARHLVDKGVKQMVVANRTLDNALEIAHRFDAHGALLSDIPEQLVHADIVVSSTNSQLPLLGKGAVENALRKRKHKPMLLIDLAVPRDIESEVSELDDAYLYSVDDISEVIEDNVNSRAEAAAQAESIIERGVQEFVSQLRSLNAVATLRAFREKAEGIRLAEVDRAARALEKGESPAEVLDSLARALTNKLIHSPSVQMKKASAEGRDEILKATRELFDLDQPEPDQDEDEA